MELLQEEFTGSNDHSPLIKRKRAKRKTPLSPPTTVTSSSSTGSAHGETCLPIPSPTSSGNNSATKEEDEDMANCLILLARGGQKSDSSLYDCKTCNRTFPSFQALGGHRASHKKPKSDIEVEEEEGKEEETKVPKTNKTITSPPFPFHSETKKAAPTDHNKSASKAHGCSICGVVFSSGQALGGHMRRHRAPPPATPQVSTSDKVNSTAESREADDEPPRKFTSTLDLDLNLPAPFEDDFEFVASKRRFVLVSGPALVDCYY
ncbi:hypothetical protein RHSIM_Rhsim01G0210500 [Rhododendron simsii]|uniref:C2H2-type domain-containing protein n=1 Tax=Rhododendron simsii TaxID=118357 RepID=A0A834HKV0_RHOSS|nr:hypothetical protein RHSIM_Rhsim01G0210500 [Rhododendron simsii]